MHVEESEPASLALDENITCSHPQWPCALNVKGARLTCIEKLFKCWSLHSTFFGGKDYRIWPDLYVCLAIEISELEEKYVAKRIERGSLWEVILAK